MSISGVAISLQNGQTAYVDEEDFEYVSSFSRNGWYATQYNNLILPCATIQTTDHWGNPKGSTYVWMHDLICKKHNTSFSSLVEKSSQKLNGYNLCKSNIIVRSGVRGKDLVNLEFAISQKKTNKQREWNQNSDEEVDRNENENLLE